MNFSNKTHCLNCNTTITHDYCGGCGQQKAQRISFSLLIKIMQQGIIEFKSPLLVTFLGLFTNPGKVYREYLAGRRVKYFNPIRYSFWLTTLALFVAAYFKTSIFDFGIIPSNEKLLSSQQLTLKIEDLLESSIIYITFIYALFSAAVLKLFFRNEKYSVIELYIPCLLNLSQMYVLAILLFSLGYYNSVQGQITYAICSIFYFVWGISHLFEPRNWKTYIKTLFSGLISFILFSIIFGMLLVFSVGVQEGFKATHNKEINKTVSTVESNKKTQE